MAREEKVFLTVKWKYIVGLCVDSQQKPNCERHVESQMYDFSTGLECPY